MNIRLLFIWLFLAIGCCSCNSATESQGIDAVLDFYGGQVSYSKGVRSSTEDKLQGRFYELKLRGVAERMKQHFSSLQSPASNCAYLFYHTLAPDEKNNYSFIRVTIEGDNTSNTYEFDTTKLAQVEQAMALVDQVMEYMRTADYGAFLAKGSSQVATEQQWQQAKVEFVALDQRCGVVKSFRLQSFELVNHNLASGAKRFVGLAGVLVREKQNTAFSLVLDPAVNSQSEYMYGFNLAK